MCMIYSIYVHIYIYVCLLFTSWLIYVYLQTSWMTAGWHDASDLILLCGLAQTNSSFFGGFSVSSTCSLRGNVIENRMTTKFRKKTWWSLHKYNFFIRIVTHGYWKWYLKWILKEVVLRDVPLPGVERSASKKFGPWCQQGADGAMEGKYNGKHKNLRGKFHGKIWGKYTPLKTKHFGTSRNKCPFGKWKNHSHKTPWTFWCSSCQLLVFWCLFGIFNFLRQRSWRNIADIAWTGSASVEKPTTRSRKNFKQRHFQVSFPGFLPDEFEELLNEDDI